LRYINKLTSDGYIERCADPADRRRSFISLTERGHVTMDAIFDQLISPKSSDRSDGIS
ncbi:MAG: Winged helix DNA-binding domain, partial [Pseudomonadota bacterium]